MKPKFGNPISQKRSQRNQSLQGESGEATIEFVGLTITLLIPLVYLILIFFQIQAGLYAAEAGAEGAARILTLHPDTGVEAADTALRLAVEDQGLPVDSVTYSLDCDAGDCPEAGSTGTIHVSLDVPLPLVGNLLQGSLPTNLTLHSEHPIKWGEHGA